MEAAGQAAHATEDPRIRRSRERILDAAIAEFLVAGYDGTSVDAVAQRADVAKRTVYNIYGDKEALFRSALLRSIGIAESFTAAVETDGIRDPGTDLPDLAARLARAVLLGPVLPLRRLLAAESARFPELVREYRRRAPDAVLTRLERTFADLARARVLDLDDPALAAEHFAFLAMGADLDRGMLGGATPPSARAIEQRARAGAAAFLRAYRRG